MHVKFWIIVQSDLSTSVELPLSSLACLLLGNANSSLESHA